MERKWCMCTEIKGVARDGFSTCMICGGKDAYGGSPERRGKYRKTIAANNNEQNGHNAQQPQA
jgi:hypothetical protein